MIMSLEMRQKQAREFCSTKDAMMVTAVISETLEDRELVPNYSSTMEVAIEFLEGLISESVELLQYRYRYSESDARIVLDILNNTFTEFKD